MRLNIIAALATLALVMPALGQEAPSYDEQSGAWTNVPPPPPESSGDGYATQPNVDVSMDAATPGASVTFDTFHDGLAPYGQWVTVGSYGRVWRPGHVAAGWRPYYYGRWEWTNEGWLWVSDEPWGWAAYHYGRWAYDSYYGWVWVPGYQWAPAWVTWRYSPEYIGWAPLGPGFSVYVTNYPVVYGWWTFVPCHRFVGVPIHSVAFTGSHVRGIWGATRPAPPRAAVFGARAPAWGGPARPFVEQRVGRPITPVRIQSVTSPAAIAANARPGVVPIYRPEARLPAARAAAPAFTNRSPAASGAVRPAPAPASPARPPQASAPALVRPQGSAPMPQAVRPQGTAPMPQAARPQGPAPMPQAVRPQGSAPMPQAARPQGGYAPARPQQYTAPPPQHAAPRQYTAPPRTAPAPAPARPAQGNPAARPQSFQMARPGPATVARAHAPAAAARAAPAAHRW